MQVQTHDVAFLDEQRIARVKVSQRCGFRPNARQIAAFAIERVLQCVAPAGISVVVPYSRSLVGVKCRWKRDVP